MTDDKPRAAIRYMLHDWARLHTALRGAGCDPALSERLATEIVAARHSRPARRADTPTPEYDWIEGRWAPRESRDSRES